MHSRFFFAFVFISFFSAIGLHAQPNIEWQKTLGGSAEDIAYDVEQTTDGGFIVAGESRSVDGDISGNHGWKDYWVVKLASDGSIEWENSYGGTHHDIATDIFQTIDGGYIVAGRCDSSDGQVTGHHGLTDYWVVKITSVGEIEWEKSLGGYDNDFGYAMEQTTDGGFIVAGASRSINGDVTGNHGDYDYWVVKLHPDGNIEWERSLGGSDSDFAYAIRQTSDDGYILAGKSNSTDGDVTGNNGGNFEHDFWVVKLSEGGAIEWEKSLGGTDHEQAYSVQQTVDGDYIVAGYSRSTDGDVTGYHGGWDYWIVKLTSTGDLIWQKSLGSFYDEVAHEIQQTSDGGFIINGISKGNSGDVTDNHGNQDFWLVKLTGSGEIDWQKSFGGTNEDRGFAVKQTEDEGFILAGRTKSTNGDVTGNQGENDFWVVKLGACGVNTALEIDMHTIQSLEAANSSTFQWIDCSDWSIIPGADSSTFTPDIGGEFAVILSNGTCIDTSECVAICPLSVELSIDGYMIQAIEDSPNATFQWIDCNTGTNIEGEVDPDFEPDLNGQYAVVVSEWDCSVTSECITICPVSINTEIISSPETFQSLADTLNTTFQWIDCSTGAPIVGETSSSFSPTVSGDYALIINQGGCEESSDCLPFCLVDSNVTVLDNTIQSLADVSISIFQWIDCSDNSPIEGETDYMFTPTVSGTYAVVIQQGNCIDTSACSTICLIDSEVYVNENTIQSLADTLNSTFQWINCSDNSPIEGETSSFFTPSESGNYAVIIHQGSCVDTSECESIIIVGLEGRNNSAVKVFPNPAHNLLIMETESKMVGSIYTIYGSDAKKVASGKIETRNTIIPLKGLANGMYTIKIESQEEDLSIQFIKSDE